jgi:hypothetical protein
LWPQCWRAYRHSLSRKSAEAVLADRTQELAAPTVMAEPAKPGAPVNSFMLPGNVTALPMRRSTRGPQDI